MHRVETKNGGICRYLYLLMAALLATGVQAQGYPSARLYATTSRVMFTHIDNPVYVVLSNLSASQIRLVAEPEDMATQQVARQAGDTIYYNIIPQKTGSLTLKVHYQPADNDLSYSYDPHTYIIQEMPPLVLHWGRYSGGSVMRRSDIRNDSVLWVSLSGTSPDYYRPVIRSFTISHPLLDKPVAIEGATLNPDVMALLQRGRVGSRVSFDNIVVELADGTQQVFQTSFTLY